MRPDATPLDRRSAALALAVTVAVLFNTALTWAKETYEPLRAFMISLTGHHWTTHGLLVLAVFALLGAVFSRTNIAARMRPTQLMIVLVGAVVLAGAGLFTWFAWLYWL